jgi:type I restriction enzyme S subunit
MPDKWRRHQVSTLIRRGALVIGDGYRAKNEELSPCGLPFARAGNINDGFHFDGADCFPEQHIGCIGNKVSEPGDVVFTSKGTVGRFAFVRSDTPRFVYSPQLCFWRSKDRGLIDPRFLFYWMFGREFFVQFMGVAGQTDMAAYVSLTDQRQMQITLPPLPEQRAIAGILGALDDKIELNRRMNRALGEMARTIFEAWFVAFEPVRAKMAGRAPTSCSPEVAALFPSRLVPSELGLIPEGWRVSAIGKLVRALGGSTPSTKIVRYWEPGTIPWATPKDLSGLPSVALLGTSRKISERGLEQISSGLLPRGTVLMSSRAPVGYLALACMPLAINQGFIAMVCNGPVSNLYALNWLRDNMPAIRQQAGGTTFAEISKASFRPIPAIRPRQPVMNAFTSAARPIYAHIEANERESRTLAELRDSLLPKLMSGQVRLPESR